MLICRDCRFYKDHGLAEDGRCNHPNFKKIDLVTGDIFSYPKAKDQRYPATRGDARSCGSDGRLFERAA